jgi:hypothetical protein
MQFRNLQYAVPAADGGGDGAELIVSCFMNQDGGPIEANINRWAAQFRNPEGMPSSATPTREEVNGLTVHRVEFKGSYMGMGAPGPKPGFGQLSAIIETPDARAFIRLIGPDTVIEANRAAFDAMVKGVTHKRSA